MVVLLGLGMTASVQAEVLAAASQYGIPGQVLVNLAQTESGGNQAAIGPVTSSGQRAGGVMQLMPDTAAGLGVDPTDEQQNIQGGAMYLSQMFAMFGNWHWAVLLAGALIGCAAQKPVAPVAPTITVQAQPLR